MIRNDMTTAARPTKTADGQPLRETHTTTGSDAAWRVRSPEQIAADELAFRMEELRVHAEQGGQTDRYRVKMEAIRVLAEKALPMAVELVKMGIQAAAVVAVAGMSLDALVENPRAVAGFLQFLGTDDARRIAGAAAGHIKRLKGAFTNVEPIAAPEGNFVEGQVVGHPSSSASSTGVRRTTPLQLDGGAQGNDTFSENK